MNANPGGPDERRCITFREVHKVSNVTRIPKKAKEQEKKQFLSLITMDQFLLGKHKDAIAAEINRILMDERLLGIVTEMTMDYIDEHPELREQPAPDMWDYRDEQEDRDDYDDEDEC